MNTPSLFERLVDYLRQAKAAKSLGESFSYADFFAALRKLKDELPALHAQLIIRGQLSKLDARKEAETLKELFMLVRSLNDRYQTEVEELRTAASAKVKTVYLPATGKYL